MIQKLLFWTIGAAVLVSIVTLSIIFSSGMLPPAR